MESREIIKELKKITEQPFKYLGALKEQGREFVFYTCSYVPEEIIYAFDFLPVRLLGFLENHDLAGSHLQPYCCPVGKSVLEDILSRKLPVHNVIFSNTCDTMQRISDIARINMDINHFDLMFPLRVDVDIAKEFFYKEVLRLISFLEKIKSNGTLDDKKLKGSIELFNEIRKNILELSKIFVSQNEISNSDLNIIYLAGQIMDRKRYLEILKQLINTLKSKISSSENSKRIILTGSMCLSSSIYEILDNINVKVVYSDMCNNVRPYMRDSVSLEDGIKGIVDSLFLRPICACKYSGVKGRISHLKEKAKEYKADGILYIVPKFCDPHSFDFPDIRDSLDIPVLLLEIEQKNMFSGQQKTRIEAFLETL